VSGEGPCGGTLDYSRLTLVNIYLLLEIGLTTIGATKFNFVFGDGKGITSFLLFSLVISFRTFAPSTISSQLLNWLQHPHSYLKKKCACPAFCQ
jgi:hypothetical protein